MSRPILVLAPVASSPPSLPGSFDPRLEPAPLSMRTTAEGLRVACYAAPLASFPVDFFADPDGRWSFQLLAEAAGFELDAGVAVGALTADHFGHPEGSALVTLNAEARPYVAIIECPIAFTCAEGAAEAESAEAWSAA